MPPAVSAFLWLATILLVPTVLYLGREFFIPVVLATYLSFLLALPVRGLVRLGFWRGPAVGTVVALFAFALIFVGWVVVGETRELVEDFSRDQATIETKLRSVRQAVQSATQRWTSAMKKVTAEPSNSNADADDPAIVEPASITVPMAPPEEVVEVTKQEEPIPVETVTPWYTVAWSALSYVGPVIHPLTTIGVALLFLVFFLVYQDDLADRIIRLCGRTHIHVTAAALTESGRRVTRYLGAQATANSVAGFFIGVGLFLLGVPNPALWGLLAAVLRFIPYVGATIACIFPMAQTLATSDSWTLPILVVVMSILIDVACANLVEPWLFGNRIGVSPTAVVVTFVFWTWLWGGIGLMLAMPMTVCLVVLGQHIPALEGLAVTLGDKPALEPFIRFYYRLLAGDKAQAWQVLRAATSEEAAEESIDQVVVPGVASVQRDFHAGLIGQEQLQRASELTRQLLADLLLPLEAAPKDSLDGCIVLDRGAFDSLLPLIIERVGRVHIPESCVLSADRLANEVADQIVELGPPVVLLAAIEPRDMSRFAHVQRRLRDNGVRCRIITVVFCVDTRRRFGSDIAELHVNPSIADLISHLRTASQGKA